MTNEIPAGATPPAEAALTRCEVCGLSCYMSPPAPVSQPATGKTGETGARFAEVVALADELVQPRAICTKCGWGGKADELRALTPMTGPTQCPRCPYTAMVVGPSEQLERLSKGTKWLLASLSTSEAAHETYRLHAEGMRTALRECFHALDGLLGDSDLPDDDRPGVLAMQSAVAALATGTEGAAPATLPHDSAPAGTSQGADAGRRERAGEGEESK